MKDTKIVGVDYRTIFDSRGVETLEIDIITEKGFGRAAAPFGAPGSRGEFEAPAYSEEGIDASIKILKEEIIPNLIGMDAMEQERIDALLKDVDGTANFQRIGGNTSTVLSVAAAKAAAASVNEPLFKIMTSGTDFTFPFPMGNVIGGGAHGLGTAPDMQEHLIVPVSAKTVREAVAVNIKVHEIAGKILEKRIPSFAGGTDDENAWVADLNDIEAFDVLKEACDRFYDSEGIEVRIGLDLAADRLWEPEKKVYRYFRENVERTQEQQYEYLAELIDRYNMIYVEDGFNSNDYESFAKLNRYAKGRCLICADDLYASNCERTGNGIKKNSAAAMIIKTNQVGTISGAKATASLAKANNLKIILSHRSGETDDSSIAHLAIAWNATMIKTGVKGGERLAKLNELLRMEDKYPQIKLVKFM